MHRQCCAANPARGPRVLPRVRHRPAGDAATPADGGVWRHVLLPLQPAEHHGRPRAGDAGAAPLRLLPLQGGRGEEWRWGDGVRSRCAQRCDAAVDWADRALPRSEQHGGQWVCGERITCSSEQVAEARGEANDTVEVVCLFSKQFTR